MNDNTTPRRLCRAYGCRAVTKTIYCQAHQHKQKESRSSTTVNNDIYNSTKWQNLRKAHFKKDPLCVECLKFNIIKPTDVIDHIKPILDYPELAYSSTNLQGLCHCCHSIKTAKETKARLTDTKTVSANELFNKLNNKQ